MIRGRRPGGAVALTGLVTFLMLFGLSASPTAFEVPVLDRIADIFVLSLYDRNDRAASAAASAASAGWGRCRSSQRTFTRTGSNGRDAPIAVIREPRITLRRSSTVAIIALL